MMYTYYRRRGNSILLKYRDDEGKSQVKIVKGLKPSLFITTERDTDLSPFVSIFNEPLKEIQQESFWESDQFLEKYKHVDEFVIHGNTRYENQFIIEAYDGKPVEYNTDHIVYGFLDIETLVPSGQGFPDPSTAKWPISAYSLYNSQKKTFYCAFLHKDPSAWTLDKSPEDIKQLSIDAQIFDDETDLVINLLNHIRDFDYDIISGWNSEGFDVPYLINRATRLLGRDTVVKILSPFNEIREREKKKRYGGNEVVYDIIGRSHLDYLNVYRKHVLEPRESYKLDYIATVELGEGKIDHSEYDDLTDLYENDPQTYFDYNIKDVSLLVDIEEKRGLMSLTFAITYYTLCNFEETLGTVVVWEKLIARHLYNTGKVPLSSGRGGVELDEQYEGAFVYDPITGKHEWIVSYDLNSLYPMTEIQYNIGPDTHIPYRSLPKELKEIKDANYTIDDLLSQKVDLSALKKYDVAMTANFEFYRKDRRSFFSEIKDELYTSRKTFKNEMLEHENMKEAVKAEMRRRGLL